MTIDRETAVTLALTLSIFGAVAIGMIFSTNKNVPVLNEATEIRSVSTNTGDLYTNVPRPDWGKVLEAYEWSAKEIYDLTQRVHAGTTNVGFGTNFAMFASSNGVLTIWWGWETEAKRHKLEKGPQ